MVKILVADGQRSFAKLVSRKITSELGYEAVTAHSRKEAEEKIASEKDGLSLAVLDVNLADDEGGGIVDFFLSRKVPVIATVPGDEDEKKEMLQGKDLTDYVFKNTSEDLDYLLSRIKRVISNRKIKVMVVDDALTYRVGMKGMLETQLFDIFEAGDGVEALEVLEKHPDMKIILTDYNMPRMDGYELVSKIRQKHKKDKLSIIVISGTAEKDMASKFLKIGANDYITKPFSKDECNWRVNINAEHLELIESINDLANRDFLTGLYNRRYFFRAGKELLERAEAGGLGAWVAVVDIDHFKRVNDTYGHEVGDLAIKRLASVLADGAGPDRIPARLGGEEFCILSTERDGEKSAEICENIRKTVERQVVEFNGNEIRFTVSMGITAKRLKTLDGMINAADVMLYVAKNGGRNRVCADGAA